MAERLGRRLLAMSAVGLVLIACAPEGRSAGNPTSPAATSSASPEGV